MYIWRHVISSIRLRIFPPKRLPRMTGFEAENTEQQTKIYDQKYGTTSVASQVLIFHIVMLPSIYGQPS